MKTKIWLLAGALGGVLGATTLIDRPEAPSTGVVVIGRGTQSPAQQSPGRAPVIASLEMQRLPEVAVAPHAAAVPADYPYWEGGDPGVWATPAEFSGTK